MDTVQLMMLKIFKNYKAFARRDKWESAIRYDHVPNVDFDIVVNTLVLAGYLKQNKAGAISINKDRVSEWTQTDEYQELRAV